ncbi:hypothetical protein NFI96_008132 [Prochilodus magdalenae]|nr:hypothetical protein NFI96_008132 [Prochilodus magdalenae]
MRKKVIEDYQSGKGYKAISKFLGLQQTTVRAIIHEWRKCGAVVSLPRSGQSTKIAPRAQRRIIQEVTIDLTTISKELQASLASVKVICGLLFHLTAVSTVYHYIQYVCQGALCPPTGHQQGTCHRIKDCSSDTVISSTGAPQGTVLSPVLFTLYTSDFKYNSELCHMQKFSDDTAIVGCVRKGQEREYRSLVEDFVEWCTTNHLKLNITKTKEMCIDFRRSRPSQQPISIKGVDVEVVRSYRYLGVHLDERLDWSVNTDIVYKKAQSRLYFLRRLGSFRICQKLLLMFYQSVVASVLFYAVVCWGGSISKRDAGRLDRLVKKAGSVLGLELESLTPLAERRALNKLLHIMDNVHHPLHTTIIRQRSSFSGRLLSQSCSTDRLRKSFVPQAIRLFNSSQYSR